MMTCIKCRTKIRRGHGFQVEVDNVILLMHAKCAELAWREAHGCVGKDMRKHRIPSEDRLEWSEVFRKVLEQNVR